MSCLLFLSWFLWTHSWVYMTGLLVCFCSLLYMTGLLVCFCSLYQSHSNQMSFPGSSTLGTKSEFEKRGSVSVLIHLSYCSVDWYLLCYSFYTCVVCKKTFVTTQKYTEHCRIHTGQRVECDYCQKTYSQESALYAHLRSKHPDVKHKVLHKAVRKTSTISTQTNIGHNSSVYVCSVCGYKFGNFNQYLGYQHRCT